MKRTTKILLAIILPLLIVSGIAFAYEAYDGTQVIEGGIFRNSIRPMTDSAYTMGENSYRWSAGYFDDLYTRTLAVSATTTFAISTFAKLTVTGELTVQGTTTLATTTITALTVSGVLTIPNNSVDEADINFTTACAAGNHYYLSGNDLACEADDDTTYTAAGTLLDLTGGAFSVNEGTLTSGKTCIYTSGTGLVCDTTLTVGTVTSVGLTMPTGLVVAGSPVTTSSVLAISMDSGYVIVLDASTTEWATAYGWGDHAGVGYLTTLGYTGLTGYPAEVITAGTGLNWVASTTLNWSSAGLTWGGTTIGTQYGGTGRNWATMATGSIIYFSDTGVMSALAGGTSGYFLKAQGVGVAPVWASDNELTEEEVEDFVGGMLGGTETLIMVDYVDGGVGAGAINFIVNADLSQFDNTTSSYATTGELHTALTITGEDFLSLGTQQITANAINPDNLANTDFGDFSCDGTNCSFDTDTIGTAEMADADHGDVAWSSGVASVQDLTITSEAKGDILYFDSTNWVRLATGTDAYVLTLSGGLPTWAASGSGYSNLTEFVDQTAWRMFYSNAAGDVTELALGTTGQYLKSTGVSAVPGWDTPAGAGDVIGPASSADHSVARFNGTDNKTIQDSLMVIDDSGNVTGVANFTMTGTLTLDTDFTGILRVDSGVVSTTTDDDVPEVGDFDAFPAGDHLTYDTGANQLNVDAELKTGMITFSVRNATSTQNPASCHKFATAVTIVRISGSTNNSTSSVQIDERTEATPYSAGTNVMTSALELSTVTASTTSFSNAGIVADAPFCLDIDIMNGNATTSIFLFVDYTIDD